MMISADQVSTTGVRWDPDGAAVDSAEEAGASVKAGWGQTKLADILKKKVRCNFCRGDRRAKVAFQVCC